MSRKNRTSRRRFLAGSAQGATLLGLGGTVCYLASQNRRDHDRTSGSVSGEITLASFKTDARRPRGIAVGHEDRVFIAADQGVLSYSYDGMQLCQIKHERPVRCVATRANGEVLVGLAHHVEVFDSDLSYKTSWPSLGRQSLITGLATANDDVLVADAAQRVIWRCDSKGNTLSGTGCNVGFSARDQFFSLAVSGELLHVAKPQRHRIETYTLDGEFLSSWGRHSRDLAGFSGCCNPVSFAVLSDGRFVTAERGQPRVKLYDVSGQFMSLLAKPEQFTANAHVSADDNGYGCQTGGLDVAIDSRERILILDRVTGEVRILA